MHGTHGVVGTHCGAEEAAFEVEALHVVFERELDRLGGEVADDDHRGRNRSDGCGFSDPD